MPKLYLAAIILIAVLLRFFQLDQLPPGMLSDEAVNGCDALQALRGGDFQVFYTANNGREGLFINIQALLLALFGEREAWVLRLASAAFGSLTVLGLYLLAAELFGRKVALASAFLMATGFWHISLSRIGLRPISGPCFFVWGTWFFVLAFRKAAEGVPRARVFGLGAAAGAIIGLGFHTYIPYRLMPALLLPVFMYFLWFAHREKWTARFFQLTAIVLACSVLSAWPLLHYFWTHPEDFVYRINTVSVLRRPHPVQALSRNLGQSLTQFNWEGDGSWKRNIRGQPLLFWPVGLLFLIGLSCGVSSARRGRTLAPDSNIINPVFASCLLLYWLGLNLIPDILSHYALNLTRGVMLTPAVYMLAGIGAVLVYQFSARVSPLLRREGGKALAVLLPCALLTVEVSIRYFSTWGNLPEVREAFGSSIRSVAIVKQIRTLPPERQSAPKHILYGVSQEVLPVRSNVIRFMLDACSEEALENNRLYFTPKSAAESLPEDVLKYWLD